MENDTKRRALGAIISNALFRWETAVTLALTAILFLFVPQPFPFWEPWFWLVGGAIAEAALVITTMTDPAAAQEAVSRGFENQYDLRQIRNPVSRQRLER